MDDDVPSLEQQPASKIHFIGGEKGGVGKSLVARLVAQHFIDQKLPFVGFDTDRSHGSLLRFYSGYASPAVVDRYEALDLIMESAVDQPGRRVLVDLAAQTHEPLAKWMDESGVLDMAELSMKDGKLPDVQAYLARFADVSDENENSLWLRLRLAQAMDKPALLHQFGTELVRQYPTSQQAKRYLANDY